MILLLAVLAVAEARKKPDPDAARHEAVAQIDALLGQVTGPKRAELLRRKAQLCAIEAEFHALSDAAAEADWRRQTIAAWTDWLQAADAFEPEREQALLILGDQSLALGERDAARSAFDRLAAAEDEQARALGALRLSQLDRVKPNVAETPCRAKEALDTTMKTAQAGWSACYEAAQVQHPAVMGRVVLDVEVGGDGKVRSTGLSRSTVSEPVLEACAVASIEGLDFGPVDPSCTVLMHYPIVFLPQGLAD